MSDRSISATDVSEAVRTRMKARHLILVVGVVLAVCLYVYFVDIYARDRNLFSQVYRGIVQEAYSIYSGAERGFYIEIGRALEDATKGRAPISVHNKPTTGGQANAMSVMTTPRSFGIIQEDTLADGNFERDKIDYVTQLYVERLHILYDKQAWANNVKAWHLSSPDAKNRGPVGPAPDPPTLSHPVHPSVQRFFSTHSVSTGPVGSGSQIFARYVLSVCKVGPIHDLESPFSDALQKLQRKPAKDEKLKLAVIFTIAGAPLKSVTELLDSGDYGLMSIDTALVPELNRLFGLKLRGTSFNGKYDEGHEISTVGSWSYLIASKDVPTSARMEVISMLRSSKERIKERIELGGSHSFQLDEFDFYETYRQEHVGFLMSLVQNSLIFVVSVSLTTVAILVVLSWLLSGIRKVTLFRRLMSVYRDHLPENKNLDYHGTEFPVPVIHESQIRIISRLVEGMSRLLQQSASVRTAYEKGEIITGHYEHLLASIEAMKDIVRRNLAQRLNEHLQRNGGISDDVLRHFYTAGYLLRDDYRALVRDSTLSSPGDQGRPIEAA